MKKLLFLLAVGTGAVVATQWPEIQRYMKMRNM